MYVIYKSIFFLHGLIGSKFFQKSSFLQSEKFYLFTLSQKLLLVFYLVELRSRERGEHYNGRCAWTLEHVFARRHERSTTVHYMYHASVSLRYHRPRRHHLSCPAVSRTGPTGQYCSIFRTAKDECAARVQTCNSPLQSATTDLRQETASLTVKRLTCQGLETLSP